LSSILAMPENPTVAKTSPKMVPAINAFIVCLSVCVNDMYII
jgi:hypothetical protein